MSSVYQLSTSRLNCFPNIFFPNSYQQSLICQLLDQNVSHHKRGSNFIAAFTLFQVLFQDSRCSFVNLFALVILTAFLYMLQFFFELSIPSTTYQLTCRPYAIYLHCLRKPRTTTKREEILIDQDVIRTLITHLETVNVTRHSDYSIPP